ncbi:hypothetical protein [Pedobacter sp. Leaf194]|uniref:hypothetical protein n=1 Tax=Pedobacter sp. Leaf194 TaxID=1736297 RepID=UPI0012FB7456|nr:hypothetical protein [Pedobacter sp. Leaf194]
MDKKINSHCIRMYFNDEEYALLSEHEKVLGITKQQLVRKVLLDKAKSTIINARELLVFFDDIGKKLSGANALIYQHFSNRAGTAVIDEKIEENFEAIVKDYLNVQKSLEQAIRLLLSKMKT